MRQKVLFLTLWLLLPVSGPAQQISILDTVYAPAEPGGPMSATIYIPSVTRGAGVVLTHGYTADRQSLALWCDTLASNGYVAMTIDYHDLSDTGYGKYPGPERLHKVAVEFLRRNSVRFGLHTGKVF